MPRLDPMIIRKLMARRVARSVPNTSHPNYGAYKRAVVDGETTEPFESWNQSYETEVVPGAGFQNREQFLQAYPYPDNLNAYSQPMLMWQKRLENLQNRLYEAAHEDVPDEQYIEWLQRKASEAEYELDNYSKSYWRERTGGDYEYPQGN